MANQLNFETRIPSDSTGKSILKIEALSMHQVNIKYRSGSTTHITRYDLSDLGLNYRRDIPDTQRDGSVFYGKRNDAYNITIGITRYGAVPEMMNPVIMYPSYPYLATGETARRRHRPKLLKCLDCLMQINKEKQ